MTRSSDYEKLSRYFVRLIDILYAITFGAGLLRISDRLELPEKLSNIKSLTFLLFVFALVVVIRDWITYHKIIDRRPHKNIGRFILDILILFVFYQMVRSLENPVIFFILVAGHFCLVILWTLFDYGEYKQDRESIVRDIKWDLGFLFLFILTLLGITLSSPCGDKSIILISFGVYLLATIIRGL